MYEKWAVQCAVLVFARKILEIGVYPDHVMKKSIKIFFHRGTQMFYRFITCNVLNKLTKFCVFR